MKINGSLVFDASSSSEIQNLRVQKLAGTSVPVYGAADAGRLIYVTATEGGYTAGTLYFGSAAVSNWVAIATGGNAAALQTEVDAIETALGAGIDGSGSFVSAAFDSPIASATSFTDAINQLAVYATGNNTLAELDDVSLTAAASGDFLRYNGTAWTDATISLATDLGITASAAELNVLDGITASTAELNVLDGITASTAELNILTGATLTTTELNYVDGVTSPIQTQLDNKQALDATLTALAGLDTTTGFVVQTGTDVFTKRTLVEPAAGFTITNADGVSGNAVFALANDLAALEGLATTGIIVRTGDGTATTRTITGTVGNITVADGNGVGGEPTINLAAVTQADSGNFRKITLDGFGRVTGNTAVTTADITALVDATYVNIDGDTMAGNLSFPTGFYVSVVDAPTADTHVTNKAYVDALAAGLTWKNAVHVMSTTDVSISSAPAAIDGHTLNSGERVLLTGQTTDTQNGIYVFNGAGSAMTRALDADVFGELNGAAVFVQQGTLYADTGWTQTATLTGFGGQVWSQFSGANAYTWGDGLKITGNTVDVNMGAGIAVLPSDQVGIDLYDEPNGALILTTDGSTHSTDAASKLYLKLDAAGALAQTVAGLKINAASVTNAMLVNSGFGLLADSGTDTLPLGDSLHLTGVSTQGISVAVTEAPAGTSKFTITAADASSSQKGVATFDATEFTVTSGNVVLGTIANNKLANSTISFAGSTGSDAVALGETFTFVDGGSHTTAARLIDTTIGTNDVTIKVREATASLLGVASFDAAHFSVTAGAVSLNATLDDLANVSTADTASTGDLLTKTAGDWQPVSRTALVGSVTLNDIGDVATTHVDGNVLVSDGTNWVNQKVYHLHSEGTAATTWTVTHNLGQKYCNVTVVDAADEVVIPQSITFDSTSQLTVTFNTAIAGKVVVMGIA